MNQSQDLDERLRAHLANEATTRAPGWVLDNLLDSVQSTPQRRRPWMPRRYRHMSASFKLAVGTAIIALVSAGGLALRPLGTDTGNGGFTPDRQDRLADTGLGPSRLLDPVPGRLVRAQGHRPMGLWRSGGP